MTLSPMKFKDYVWPHNPRVYEISYRKDIISHRVPFGLYALQNTGRRHRVLRGEGEFCGADAYRQFQRLASVFYENTPGTLVHPLWMTTSAYFVSLELMQEPRENYVRYSFEFWECYDGYDTSFKEVRKAADGNAQTKSSKETAKSYTVQSGDTFGTIAGRNGLTLEEMIRLNPQIKNIHLIYAGQTLKVR